LDKIDIPEAKTKKAAEILKNLSKIKNFATISSRSKVLVLLPNNDKIMNRSLRNIKNTKVEEARNLNTLEILSHKFIIMPQASARVLSDTFSK
jgi:ribosomal protein L4